MTTNEALTVLEIVRDAERERRGDWRAYERAKRQLDALNLRADEYERSVRKIAKALAL